MKQQYHMRLPGEQSLQSGENLCDGGTDVLIKTLLDKKITGYFRVESDPFTGFAIIRKGILEDGYFLKGGEVLSTSVAAMLDFRILCDRQSQVWACELPERILPFVHKIHLGGNIIPVTDTRLISFNSIYKLYKDKIKEGLLIVNDVTGNASMINVEDFKWKLMSTREEFDKMMGEEGSQLTFIEYDAEKIAKKIENASQNSATKLDINTLLKRDILEFIETNYGDKAANLAEKIQNQDISPDNYTGFLKEVDQFINFFIDDKQSKKKMENLKSQLKNRLAEEH